MAHNHLEQLLAEWYEYQGYFVKRNVQVGKRLQGGYECELDIVAFHPGKNHLVHLEPSMDADSWPIRERRFKVKFDAGKKYIPGLFKGLSIPEEIEQFVILVFGSAASHATLAGGKVTTAADWVEQIFHAIKDKKLDSNAIPEQWPILRSFQYVNQYREVVMKVWKG